MRARSRIHKQRYSGLTPAAPTEVPGQAMHVCALTNMSACACALAFVRVRIVCTTASWPCYLDRQQLSPRASDERTTRPTDRLSIATLAAVVRVAHANESTGFGSY